MKDQNSTSDEEKDNTLLSIQQDTSHEHQQPQTEKISPRQTTIPIVYAENNAAAATGNSCDVDNADERSAFDSERKRFENLKSATYEGETMGELKPEARISNVFRRGNKAERDNETESEGRDGTTTVESTTPGAVAVTGNPTLNSQNGDINDSQDRLSAENDIRERYDGRRRLDVDEPPSSMSTMIVEATAVEEVVATEVIAEPLSPNLSHLNIQRVAIDDDGVEGDNPEQLASQTTPANQISSNTDEKDEFGPRVFPPRCQIILVLLVVVSIFALVCCAVVWVVIPPREDVITEDPVEDGGNPCILAKQETQMYLENLLGIQWIEIFLGSAVLSTLLYHFLDLCQDEYCAARANPEGRSVGEHFFYNMVLVLLDAFWLVVAIAIIVLILLENLKYPADLIRDKCISRSSFNRTEFFENPTEYLDSRNESFENRTGLIDNIFENSLEDPLASERQQWRIIQMQDLSTYLLLTVSRIPVLLFVLIARGRLMLKKQSCQHIALFWRRFWFCLKVLLEVVVFTLATIGTFTYLKPVVDQVDDLDPLS